MGGGALFAIVGGLVGWKLTPADATQAWQVALPAIGAGVGIVVGIAVVFSSIFIWNLVRAPYRQRNEAWRELETTNAEHQKELARITQQSSSVQNELDILRKMPATQVVVPSHYIPDRVINGRVINMSDLLSPGPEPSVISNRTIEDCEIKGPAMIFGLPPNGVSMYECQFEGGENVDSIFVEIVTPRMLFGAIGVRNCVFRRCRFVGIGFLDNKQGIERMKAQLMPPTSHKEDSAT